MFMFIQFCMIQTFLYKYADDILQNQSESIYAIFSTMERNITRHDERSDTHY